VATVLVIDDQPNRYSALLERLVPSVLKGGNAEFANCVRDALEKLKQKSFDILIVDMLLPETPWGEPADDGGAKVLEHLEEDDELKRPKYIIGITAAAQQSAAVAKMFDARPWLLLRTTGGGNPWEEQLEVLIRHVESLEAAQDDAEYLTDLCVLTALRSPEFEALALAGFELPEPLPVDSATFAQRGSLMSAGRSLSVVAACCLRMGSVESALLAAKMIERFRPRMLALAGICAGFEDKVQYGDVIVANPCWDYMSRKISTDDKGKTTFSNLPDYISVDTEVASRFDLLRQDSTWFQSIHAKWNGEKLRGVPALHIGPSATGPAVIADAGVLESIRREQNRATIGLEMEAYGVYSAVRMASRPRPLVFSAKSVCDYGSFMKDDKYQKYAAFVSASVVLEFGRRFGADLSAVVG
jgi:nucleoside phosphorylase/CheY-like chemotaxis protein